MSSVAKTLSNLHYKTIAPVKSVISKTGEAVRYVAKKAVQAEKVLEKALVNDVLVERRPGRSRPRRAPANKRYHGPSIPYAMASRSSKVVKRWEFVTSIPGSTGFSYFTKAISPINQALFPWLCKTALNYEEYRFKSLKFHFKSLCSNVSTTGSLGSIMMGITYDPNDPTLSTYSSMANYAGFKPGIPTKDMTISVKTADQIFPVHFIQHDQDNFTSDLGVFYFVCNGNTATTEIGQLWVEYEVELMIPRTNTSTTMSQMTYCSWPSVLVYTTGTIGCFPQDPVNLGYPGYYSDSQENLVSFKTVANTGSLSDTITFRTPAYYHIIVTVDSSNATNQPLAAPSTYTFGRATTFNPSAFGTSFAGGKVAVSAGGTGYCMVYLDIWVDATAGTPFNPSTLTVSSLGTAAGAAILNVSCVVTQYNQSMNFQTAGTSNPGINATRRPEVNTFSEETMTPLYTGPKTNTFGQLYTGPKYPQKNTLPSRPPLLKRELTLSQRASRHGLTIDEYLKSGFYGPNTYSRADLDDIQEIETGGPPPTSEEGSPPSMIEDENQTVHVNPDAIHSGLNSQSSSSSSLSSSSIPVPLTEKPMTIYDRVSYICTPSSSSSVPAKKKI